MTGRGCFCSEGLISGEFMDRVRAEGIHIGSGDDTAVAIYYYDRFYVGHLCNGKTDQLQQP